MIIEKDIKPEDIPVGSKPFIFGNKTRERMKAGFYVRDTNKFIHVMTLENEDDIDAFLDKYHLTVVMIGKNLPNF